jgi:prophage regulatory protein
MKASLESIPANERLIRLPEVLEIIPIFKSSWWAGVKTGRYPEPIKLGPRTTCWRLSDIQAITLAGAS